MRNKNQINLEKLNTSLQKCNTHLSRLHYAALQVNLFFPLTPEIYGSITEATIGNIDQLIFRFTKLQDELGNNTFRFLLEYLQEDITEKPFRDILNILERLKIIDSADTWLSLRELRNDLTHEYPELINETIDKLNHLIRQLPLLENILSLIRRHVEVSPIT
jgi:hypothetical protein